MATKKIQENPLPALQTQTANENTDKPPELIIKSNKSSERMAKPSKDSEMTVKSDKPAPTHKPISTPGHSPWFTVPSFTKTSPNDLYRKLLPAVLFVLTFVTVMTILLIYMDTVAVGAAQFRVNMSRDYELARIPQGSAPLVAYVRQLHLAPRAAQPAPAPSTPTPQVSVLDRLYGEIYNGTFVEFLPRGPCTASALYLQAARAWGGVAARAAPRDYLALRTRTMAAHACLSATSHPREISYSENGEAESLFRSRVLCLPLYTLLLAAEATEANYVIVGGDAALPALTHVPYDSVHLQVIEVQSTDPVYRNKTSAFLATKNYTVAATFEDSVMYALKESGVDQKV